MIQAMALDTKDKMKGRHVRGEISVQVNFTAEGMQIKVINQISLKSFTLIYNLAFSFSLNPLKIKIKKGGHTERLQPFIHNLVFNKIKTGQKCHSC